MNQKRATPAVAVNLDSFDDANTDVKNVQAITSPRSNLVIHRLGYSPRDLYPILPKDLYEKGFDNKETLKIKYDSYEQKRAHKIAECREEFEVCKVSSSFAATFFQQRALKYVYNPLHNLSLL